MRLLCLLLLCFMSFSAQAGGTCHGRFINPITDVCWRCLFPIKIGALALSSPVDDLTEMADGDIPKSPICVCPHPPPLPPSVGIILSLWEPKRLVDVTRHSWCFTSLGGLTLNPGIPHTGGVVDATEAGENTSFYQAHYYISPILIWLNLLLDITCLDESEFFDIAFLSELDPTWNNDALNAILNPEAILFANPVAQLACGVADCTSASVGLPLDPLYWCAGCQGTIFPMNGHVQAHVSGVQASLLITQRLLAKLHRIGMLQGTFGQEALCLPKFYMPVWRKSQYRTQITYPIPAVSIEPFPCNPPGRTTTLYESGREFPVAGEDFAWLIWSKRTCCAFAK